MVFISSKPNEPSTMSPNSFVCLYVYRYICMYAMLCPQQKRHRRLSRTNSSGIQLFWELWVEVWGPKGGLRIPFRNTFQSHFQFRRVHHPSRASTACWATSSARCCMVESGLNGCVLSTAETIQRFLFLLCPAKEKWPGSRQEQPFGHQLAPDF